MAATARAWSNSSVRRASATSPCCAPLRRRPATCSCPRPCVIAPIGVGQTISQPFTQARYLETLGLTGKERVLEIGTGSGYQTALLGALADQVFTIERVRPLAETAQAALRAAGVSNVSVLVGDGTLGWSAYAPYHAILVAAGGPEIPPPLVEQLAPDGRMIIPLGAKGGGAQTLTLVRRTAGGIRATPIGEARFVPLVGEHGFDA